MGKYRIFTVGFTLPGDEFESVDFNSDQTLLDGDIIVFEPSLGYYISSQGYKGKELLNENSSFTTSQALGHWRSEIISAVYAGKIVIVYLVKPI